MEDFITSKEKGEFEGVPVGRATGESETMRLIGRH